MIIHSNFRDYYDSVTAFGADPTNHYNRRTEDGDVIEIEGNYYRDFKSNSSINRISESHKDRKFRFEINSHVISFCGDLFYHNEFVEMEYGVYNPKVLSTTFHSETVDELKKEIYERYGLKQPKNEPFFYHKPNVPIEEELSKIDLDALHCQEKSPVLQITIKKPERFESSWNAKKTKLQIIKNPNLSEIHFFKSVDPWNAFQTIAGYNSGVIGANAKPIIEVSNIDKIKKAGFDTKKSFRSMER